MIQSFKALFLLTFCIATGITIAQPLNTATPQKMVEVAQAQEALGDYYNALEWYNMAYKETSDKSLRADIARLNYLMRDYDKAAKYYERLFKRDKRNEYGDLKLNYGKVLKLNGDFDGAIVAFQEFLSTAEDPDLIAEAKREITGASLARESEPKKGLDVSPLKGKANSKSTETSPFMVNLDELYYASMNTNKKVVKDGKQGDYYIKIYRSTRSNGEWGEGQVLGEEINRPGFHTSHPYITPDQSRMYFQRSILNGEYIGEARIFYSPKSGDQWGCGPRSEGCKWRLHCKTPGHWRIVWKGSIDLFI